MSRQRVLTRAEVDDVIYRYEIRGETVRTLGYRYRMSPQTIANTLAAQGVTLRRPGQRHSESPEIYRGGWGTKGLIQVPLQPERVT